MVYIEGTFLALKKGQCWLRFQVMRLQLIDVPKQQATLQM